MSAHTDNERKELNSTDLLEALRYVANNAQKSPNDSVRDICNEAFDICGIPMMALWSTDSNMPIQLLPSVEALGFAECCSSGECERCGKTADLYFGNTNYWDSREGDYWCGKCVLEMHLQNEKHYADAMARESEANGNCDELDYLYHLE